MTECTATGLELLAHDKRRVHAGFDGGTNHHPFADIHRGNDGW